MTGAGTGRPDPAGLAAEVRSGPRAAISRALTLVESTRTDDRRSARTLLAALPARETPAVRVGISGVPGVGKSTLVETLGLALVKQGHRVGVLAVDPSSTRTGGSVLGDKTRMPALAAHPAVFVRPSPNAGNLGGVARSTALSILVLEAAGFDVILVETVGVGQSETTVAQMVDTLVLLLLARSGDQLQGIKRGVLELADVIAVNKADGDHVAQSRAAARDLSSALRTVQAGGRRPEVLTCSGLSPGGVEDLWKGVLQHREQLGAAGLLEKRAAQRVDLAWALVHHEIERRLSESAEVNRVRAAIEAKVGRGQLSAVDAADKLLEAFDG